MKRQLCVTFVRHGETTLNIKGVIQGHTDAHLSDTGIVQAETLGKHVALEKFTRAYASDLIRASHTAELILKHSKFPVPITTDGRLRERNYGTAEGKYFAYFYDEAKKLGKTPETFTPEGGETVSQVRSRSQQFFTELCDMADKQDHEKPENVLVVTHGGFLKVFMAYLDSSMENFVLEGFEKSRAFALSPNTGVTKLCVQALDNPSARKQRTIKFLTIADTTHLKNNKA